MSFTTVLLIRHSEAQKNIEDRHGGEGSYLTGLGWAQCKLVARHIQSEFSPLDHCRLIGHSVPQVKETVECISNELGINPTWDERLHGLNLGVLAGLSRVEAEKQWSEAAKNLELWRNGQLSLTKFRIPGAEPVEEFKLRIQAVLVELLETQDAKLLIVVCTRSTLIMLINLIQLGDHFSYDSYKPYTVECSSITSFDFVNRNARIIRINSIEHLKPIQS